MANDEFLKTLQQSLEKGEENGNAAKHLLEIDKRADKFGGGSAAEKLDERLVDSGVKQELDEKERKKAEEEYATLLAEQKENDMKLKMLANIEQQNVLMLALKNEYAKKIEIIQKKKVNLMAEFERKYGKKAEELYNFGPKPNTELE